MTVLSQAMRVVLLAILVASSGGCSKKSSADSDLPVSKDWTGGDNQLLDPQQVPGAPAPQTAGPHGDLPEGHPMVDPNGPTTDENGGTEPDQAPQDLPPSPHSDRTGPVDPTLMVRGVLKLDPKVKDRAKAGGILYLSVKKLGPDGKPLKGVLAVDRLTWTKDGAAFDLTDKMGGDASGDLLLTARIAQDEDAMKTTPGDVIGQLKLRVPADNVQLVLDTVAR